MRPLVSGNESAGESCSSCQLMGENGRSSGATLEKPHRLQGTAVIWGHNRLESVAECGLDGAVVRRFDLDELAHNAGEPLFAWRIDHQGANTARMALVAALHALQHIETGVVGLD